MDAADLAEDGGRPEAFGASDSHQPADRAFGSTDFFAAYLELVGSRATDPDEAVRVVERLQAAPSRPLSEPRAPRRTGLYALYLQGRAAVYVGKAIVRLYVERTFWYARYGNYGHLRATWPPASRSRQIARTHDGQPDRKPKRVRRHHG